MTTSHPLLDQLAEHESFVRRTLRGVLADSADVDDAIQDTWVRLLQRGRVRVLDPRSWFARVARNQAVSRRRSGARRDRREREAPRPQHPSETPEQSAIRLEARQRVAAAILDLEEPYRSVILLRYEQGLAVADIAGRTGRSEGTLRSQLSRAHAILRSKLDEEFGDRRAWAVLALPLAGRSWAVASWVAAALIVVTLAGGLGLAITMDEGRRLPETAIPSEATDGSVRESKIGSHVAGASTDAVDRTVAAGSQARELWLPPVELGDRAYFFDYERATFNFLHGVRDDPGLVRTRNCWHLLFTSNELDSMSYGPLGGIADLGYGSPEQRGAVESTELLVHERVSVRAGHTYFVWTHDATTDLASFVFIRSHVPGRTCTFDWYTTDGSGRAQGSLREAGNGEPFVRMLEHLRAAAVRAIPSRERGDAAAAGILSRSLVTLRGVAGHGGGNPHRICLDGTTQYFDGLARDPIDIDGELPVREGRASSDGGRIPPGKVFVVERAIHRAIPWHPAGVRAVHSNLRVVVGGRRIFVHDAVEEPIDGVWSGRIELRPGDEEATYLEVSWYLGAEVILSGTLRAERNGASQPFGAENPGFFEARPSTTVEREPACLAEPTAVLQAGSGASGGNAIRVDLRGKPSLHVDRVADQPLDLSSLPETSAESVVYCDGGCVDAKQAFVVTGARWAVTSKLDGGRFVRVVVAGEEVFRGENGKERQSGSWTGSLRVLPGEESRTFVETADKSSVEVVLTGHFEAR